MRAIVLIVAAAYVAGNGLQLEASEYVIHISVDGLNSSLMQTEIDAGNAPHFKRLQDEGAWTANARTDYSHTNTLPNHTTMITGRPVTQVPGSPTTVHHGYTLNVDPPLSQTLHNAGNPALSYVASVFDVAHDAGLSTAMYAAKHKFVIFDQSYSPATGAPHANGHDKIDRFFQFDDNAPPYSETSHNMFLSEMPANHFRYTFIHYADTDDAGHTSGWGSTAWKAALANVDDYLADVFELVETDPVLADKTTIILTTDHGGSGTSHSAASVPANFTIPFFVWGAGVFPGDLYAMNANVRTDPGSTRPGYAAAGQPIRNGDSGNLALDLLGLGPIPGSLINATQNLRVALPGDYNTDGIADAADYTVWRNHLGDPTEADINFGGDGRSGVDLADYIVWKQHYSDSIFSGSGDGLLNAFSSAIPEPTSAAIAVCALLPYFFLGLRGPAHCAHRRTQA